MLETYSNMLSVGISVSKPNLISSLEQSKEPWNVNTEEKEGNEQVLYSHQTQEQLAQGNIQDPILKLVSGISKQEKHYINSINEETQYDYKEYGKSFNRCSCPISHKMIISKEKGQKCQDCDQSFSHHASPQAHQRIHSADKLYKCQECGKSFSHHANL
ncbi:zinc finger protein 626-like [Alexandromys fortis]|uniref:zinc finger protein 626-like n=1 Tax=Alexandromys fortis TaxID=100897 RepID=UPI0021537595|nr:zinc finger protein 626-like [Microtus fortis]